MHRVIALVRPSQSTFELGCAAQIFGAGWETVPRRYSFETCAERPGAVTTTAGYDISVSKGLSALASADTVLIPGWSPVDTELPVRVRQALLRAHARGARLLSICTGAFALARTGLLDGRSATTHWLRAGQLQRDFPSVSVEPDRLYIDHGDVATSAGAGAGIDLCLHVVRRDHGAAHAALIARHLVLAPHRDGGQIQFVPVPRSSDAFAGMAEWVDSRLGTALSVDEIARHLGVSPRTLTRRFAAHFGTSPGAWLLARRVAMARTLLEDTDISVEVIATKVGLSSAVNLRRRFAARVGTTPSAYRRAFRGR